ncbi:MAG: heme NO-binding domain-containing protein [Armatimonadota bacterium]
MYEIINQSIQSLVTENFGEEPWHRILEKAGVPGTEYVMLKSYDDAETYRIVGAAVEVLGLPAEAILETFGKYWIGYAEQGYGDLLRFTGSNFLEFCSNLDSMHSRLKMAYPELRPPSFQCVPEENGWIAIHYRSEREGLGPIVTGKLEGSADRMGITLEIHWEQDASDGHVVYRVLPSGPGAWLS